MIINSVHSLPTTMAFGSGSRFWILALWIGVLLWECCLVSSAPAATESESNSVEIKFYLIKPSEWAEVEENFKEVIARSLTTYCKVNYEQCGLQNWADSYQFSSPQVVVYDVEDLKNYLNVTYFVKFNDNVRNKSVSVVKKAALLESLTESRKDVNERIGSDIISIGQDEYSPEPTKRLNEIIIPLVAAILFLLIIITVALYYWRKNQDLKEKRKQINELRKSKRYKKRQSQQREDPVGVPGTRSTTRVGPAPHSRTNAEPHQANGHHKPPSYSATSHSVVDTQQKASVRSSTFTFNASASVSASREEDEVSYHGYQTKETILNTADSIHRNTSLPPLDDKVKSEKKKSKRHKKHQKEKRCEVDTEGIVHGSYDQGGQALPPPAEYTRRYHDDEYHSDRSDNSNNNLPPV